MTGGTMFWFAIVSLSCVAVIVGIAKAVILNRIKYGKWIWNQ